jgi:bifunctional DNA-binding transcriptional regulator/antitoxin component of YhaV-PrlF toxin-antitoxin module
MSMGASKVTSKGQVTIPIKIRRGKKLSIGRVVVFLETEKGVMIMPLEEVEKLFEPFDRRRRQLRLTRKEIAAIVKKEKERTWKESYAEGAG